MKLKELPEFQKYDRIEIYSPYKNAKNSELHVYRQMGYYLDRGKDSELGEFIEICSQIYDKISEVKPIFHTKLSLEEISKIICLENSG